MKKCKMSPLFSSISKTLYVRSLKLGLKMPKYILYLKEKSKLKKSVCVTRYRLPVFEVKAKISMSVPSDVIK